MHITLKPLLFAVVAGRQATCATLPFLCLGPDSDDDILSLLGYSFTVSPSTGDSMHIIRAWMFRLVTVSTSKSRG
ncbi:hypothetical protein EDB87DRAFT_1637866 [Lactarius vividus]|nr:hypothetical protein EDB87DRAFT_1637866 [Lactarius vividus]